MLSSGFDLDDLQFIRAIMMADRAAFHADMGEVCETDDGWAPGRACEREWSDACDAGFEDTGSVSDRLIRIERQGPPPVGDHSAHSSEIVCSLRSAGT